MASARLIAGAVRRKIGPPFTRISGIGKRWNSSEPSNHGQPSRHRQFYGSFGAPILKVFMGAVFTYQLIYWGWLKLESIEMKKEKNDEIERLEGQLKEFSIKKKDEKKA